MDIIAILIPVVVALTEVVKRLGVDARFLPLASLVIGVLGGLYFVNEPVHYQVLYGIIIGLSAAGLFDQSKVITKIKKGE